MSDSILTSTKKNLGLDESYEVFDPDIIMHINTVFFRLHTLGIGPIEGYQILDKTTDWSDYIGTDMRMNSVKSYMSLRVRLLFDPPTTSYLKDAMEKQVAELEWLLNVQRENDLHPEYVENPSGDPCITLDEAGDEIFVVDGGDLD